MIVDRGLLAVSFLILAAVLTVWLGVAGPADLRNWQTLIAGFLAIVAAVIAYKAAMAKVNQDRLVSDQDVARRKIGLLLKTDIALEDLLTQARSLQATILFSNPTIHAFNTHGSKFAIDEPPELKDVWDNLDVFPQRALYEFRNLMFGLKHLRRLASEASELGPIEVAAGASLP